MLRNRVLWCGGRGTRTNAVEYERRELELRFVTGEDLSDRELSTARGIVYWYGEGEVVRTSAFAERTVERALDHGLAALVLAGDAAILQHVQADMEALGVYRLLTYRIEEDGEVPDFEIAQRMLKADPKLGWSAELEIETEGRPLDSGDELLLRRAFGDCERIRLARLSGGRTANAFMVEAIMSGSRCGPKPLPFFAKLGKRESIACEEERYLHYAANFVPFHLRPNLDPPRCLLGARRGVLVGNFVSGAEPLWTVLERSDGRPALASLFSQTLDGWRVQGSADPRRLRPGSIAGALADQFDHRRVAQARVERARLLGLEATPKELWGMLLGRRSQTYRLAPVHGDLHPNNVFVREVDAILIDMASVRQGPLSADPACLEASLLYDRRPGDGMPLDDWSLLVTSNMKGRRTAMREPRRVPIAWRNRLAAAAQVRAIGLARETFQGEYDTAFSIYLLRRAMYETQDETDDWRRAHGLVAAERIIVGESARMSAAGGRG